MKWITLIILGVLMCLAVSADNEYNYGWLSIAMNNVNVTTTNVINITSTNINDVPTSSYIVNSNTTWWQSFYDSILTRFGNTNLSTYLTANGYNQSVSLTPYALSADVIMKQTEAAAFKIANVTALGLQLEANAYKLANQTTRELSYFKNANATSLGFQLEANAFKRANLSLPTCVPILEGLTSDGSTFTCLSLLGGEGGSQPNTAQWIANFTSYTGDNASIVRAGNLSLYNRSISLDSYNRSINLDSYNKSINLDSYNKSIDLSGYITSLAGLQSEASAYKIANETALGRQTEASAYKKANFTEQASSFQTETPAFKNLNFSTLYNTIPYFGNLNFTTLYNAIPYFGVLNWTTLYDGRTDRWAIANFTAQVPLCSGTDKLTSADGNALTCAADVSGGAGTGAWDFTNNESAVLNNNTILRTANLTNAVCITLTGSSALCDGTDATGGGSGISFSAFNYTKGVIQTTSTTAYTSIINLTMPSSGFAEWECSIWGNASVATVGVQFEVNITGSTTQFMVQEHWTSATAKGICSGGAASVTCLPAASQGLPTAEHSFRGYSQRSGAGFLRIGLKAEAAGQVEAKAGSWCRVITL